MKKRLLGYLMIAGISAMWGIFVTAAAQTQSATGSTLRGQVVDDTDAIIPGAKVTLVLPGGKQRVVVADGSGEFVIPNVVPGVYNFFVEFKGFKPFTNPALKVPMEGPLKAVMVIGEVEIATDVTELLNGVNVEPDQNLSATVLGEDIIKDLPNDPDELQSVLQGMAGPGAGAGSGGASGAEILVNGFRGGRLPPKEAILKITINQNPYSAEFSQPGFGRIEITTKPGNDNWRGSFNTSFRNSALDARNAFATQKPDMNQRNFGFNLSGPLIKKKMSFFTNVDRRDFTGGSTTNWIDLTGARNANVLAPNDNLNFSIRTDYLINQKNTLGVSYFRSQRNAENQEFAVSFGGGFGFGPPGGGGGGGRGGGGASGTVNFTLPERGTDSNSASNDLQISNTTILSSRLINEARLRLGYDTRHSQARTAGIAVNVLDAFNGGGSPNGISDTRQFDYEIQDYLTYTLKKHTLKGGFQTQYVNQYSYSLSNFNGTYTFPSLSFYTCVTGGGINCAATGRGRYQFTVNTGAPTVRYNQYESSWFINDDYRVSQAFTLSLGLRHEFQTNLPDKNNFAPRLGIAWSPFKNRKTTFRAGAGLFYQRLNDSQYGQTLRFDGSTQLSYVIENPNWVPGFKPGDNLSTIGAAALLTTNTNIYTLDPNMKAPYTYNVNGSVERQLPFGLTGSVNLLYSKSYHVFRTRNINATRIELLTSPTADINLTRPNPLQGNILQTEASAQSEFKAMFIRIDRRMGRKFSFFANYSLTDIKSDAGTPANNYDLKSEWAQIANRHSFFLMGRISLPKGFGLNPMFNVRSGSPYNITLGQDLNRDTSFTDRPAGIARNTDLPVSAYSLITGCRTVSTTGACSQTFTDYLTQNFPNGVKAIGPGSVSMNLSLSKAFGIGKRDTANAGGGMGGMGGGGGRGGGMGGGRGGMGGGMGGMMGGGGGGVEGARYTLQFQAQITNIFNHVNYGQYSGTLTSPYFAAANTASPGRQFELSMRFNF